MDRISDEVVAQQKAAEEQASSPSAVDFEQLEAELGQIGFHPELSPDYLKKGSEEIVYQGQLTKVHRTNNFPMNFGLYDRVRNGIAADDAFARAFADSSGERRYEEIFSQFEARFPNLNLRMREIWQEFDAARRGARVSEARRKANFEIVERKYLISAAYDAMATIARKLDPGYDLHQLTG